MLTAEEARLVLLKNPTFERKVELYKEVTEIIDQMIEKGEKSFTVSDEQHYALNKELVDKGYKVSMWSVHFFNKQHVYVI